MLKNFFVTAFRNLKRNKTYSLINILGLALGISSALVLFKFISFHKSFDTHQSNYEQLYRLVRHEISANNTDKDIGVPIPLLKAFRTEYPDVGEVAMIQYAEKGQFTITNDQGNQTRFLEENIGFADESFFRLFDVEMIAGNKETALSGLGQVILSASLVTKYYGYTGVNVSQAVGKTIRLDNKVDLIISGIMEDPPLNTELPFKAIATFLSAKDIFPLFSETNWGSVSSSTNMFLLKNESVTEEDIEAKLADLIAKYQPEEKDTEEIHLQPLSDVHHNEAYISQAGEVVSKQLLWGCAVVAVILIITACINFINLATAQAVRRAKEVGVRKVMGGSKAQLITQFMSETFLITMVAMVLSLGISELVLNRLDWLLGYELTLDLANDPVMVTILFGIVVTVTLLAGLYPSFILSSLSPVGAMRRSKSGAVSGKFNMRRGLVVAQFFISQFLIICTLVVISQLNHFYQADLGFTKKSIVSFNMPEPGHSKERLLKDRLLSNPNVEMLSFHVGAPLSKNNLGSNFNYAPLANDTDFDAQFKVVDENYLDLFGIELLAGRNLTAADTLLENALISETVMHMIGFDDPQEVVGVKVKTSFNGGKTIVGVFKDFHAYSLKTEMRPIFMIGFPRFNLEGAVRIAGDEAKVNEVMATVQREWEQLFPEYTFESTVLEDSIAEDYKQEADLLTLFQIFSGIAIFIGCLGLYGLVAFIANQKTKEIGVRKVLGATVSQIIAIFSKELLSLIAFSFLIAAPLGYYVMDRWLQDFEYNVSVEAWMFLAAIAFTLLIGGFTTGFRSLRAAKANPVDSLRSE
jgi:predicted permease